MSDSDFSTGWERYRLPLLLTGGLALYGASRFDGTRPVAGSLLTYGFPLVAVALGAQPLKDSSLLRAALAVGAVAALAAELGIVHALFPEVEAFGLVPPAARAVASLLSLLGAALVQASASGRGMRNYFAGWIGMVTLVSLYLPSHLKAGRDSLDAFVAALLVSLFVGGGAGLVLGIVVSRLWPAPRRADKKNKER